jgi:hypothetical protein
MTAEAALQSSPLPHPASLRSVTLPASGRVWTGDKGRKRGGISGLESVARAKSIRAG